MLGSWLKRRVQLAAVKSGREDLERFVESLRGQSDFELGMLVAHAAVIRVSLREFGRLSDEALFVTADPEQAAIQLHVAGMVRTFQADKAFAAAAATLVWLHTLRALSTPELRSLGRKMWGQLRRGIPLAPAALEGLEKTGSPLPLGSLVACAFIPPDLDPDEGEQD